MRVDRNLRQNCYGGDVSEGGKRDHYRPTEKNQEVWEGVVIGNVSELQTEVGNSVNYCPYVW